MAHVFASKTEDDSTEAISEKLIAETMNSDSSQWVGHHIRYDSHSTRSHLKFEYAETILRRRNGQAPRSPPSGISRFPVFTPAAIYGQNPRSYEEFFGSEGDKPAAARTVF